MAERGFTLAEMNVCCVIIAVLAAIAYPNYRNMSSSMRLNSEVRELYSNFQRAKIAAVKQNDLVAFLLTGKGYIIFIDDGAGGGKRGDWVRQPGERVLVNCSFARGVRLESTTFSANRTRFNGRLGLKAGRIVLTNDRGRRVEIVVSILGRIRIARLPNVT